MRNLEHAPSSREIEGVEECVTTRVADDVYRRWMVNIDTYFVSMDPTSLSTQGDVLRIRLQSVPDMPSNNEV